jgi:hypothetical protein
LLSDLTFALVTTEAVAGRAACAGAEAGAAACAGVLAHETASIAAAIIHRITLRGCLCCID